MNELEWISVVLLFVVAVAGWISYFAERGRHVDDLAELDFYKNKTIKPEPLIIQSNTVPIREIETTFVIPNGHEVTDEEVEFILKRAWEQIGSIGINYLDVKTMNEPILCVKNVHVTLKVCGGTNSGKSVVDEIRGR